MPLPPHHGQKIPGPARQRASTGKSDIWSFQETQKEKKNDNSKIVLTPTIT